MKNLKVRVELILMGGLGLAIALVMLLCGFMGMR